MKKVLAVFLAVVMLATFVVTGFAAELPAMPSAEENKIIFAAESMYLDGYTAVEGEEAPVFAVDVYMYSNYNFEGEGTFYTGFTFDKTSTFNTELVNFLDIEYDADLATSEGFISGECYYDESLGGICSFGTSDLSILKSLDGVKIATIKYALGADVPEVPEDYEEELATIVIDKYDITWSSEDGYWSNGAYVVDPDGGELYTAIVDAEENVMPLACSGDVNTDELVFVSSHIYHRPYQQTWQERLTEWAKGIALTLVQGLISILEIVKSFLEPA